MNLACNYAVVRFLPYAETEEFVNVGVVLHCVATGYLDFRLNRKWSRVTGFFPELNDDLYREATQLFRVDLQTACLISGDQHPQQLVIEEARDEISRAFGELVRPRESLFRFGSPRTVLTDNPRAKLEELYAFYVERQFAREREYQENLMARRLKKLFVQAGTALHYRQVALGNELYSVTVPFVHQRGEIALKAIKPLDLNKDSSTKIIEHGDQWINRVKRLRDIKRLPKRFLFAVKTPSLTDSRRSDAAREIERELVRLEMNVIPFADEAQVVEFARVA